MRIVGSPYLRIPSFLTKGRTIISMLPLSVGMFSIGIAAIYSAPKSDAATDLPFERREE